MADSFGLKIGLEGEKEFKKALADINQSFKVLGSEMKLATSQFDKNDKSVEALAARNKVLRKEIDEQTTKIETLRKALQNAATSFGENDRRTQNWQIQLNNAEAALNDMNRELDENEKAIKDGGKAAEESGSKFEGFGKALKTVGVALGAVAVAAGAAAVKLGKEVINAYADYEQLVGGVDTLFKDSSQEIQRYAANAYKTAGLSANEYMETVTGFSASLIQSLGGDTEKAAKYADMAITDMSDNANKMGTDTHKRNEGEAPQFYVEKNHPAIVRPEVFEMVQEEFRRRKAAGGRMQCVSIFSGRIVCEDCGGFYGRKVWHSTSEKYRAYHWHCNNKFQKRCSCQTPTLKEESIEQAFLSAINSLIKKKKAIRENYALCLDAITDDSAYVARLEEINAECCRLQEETKSLLTAAGRKNGGGLSEVNRQYEDYLTKFEGLQKEKSELSTQISKCAAKRVQVSSFLEELQKYDGPLKEFDPLIWQATLNHAVVHKNCTITFVFRDGTEVTRKIKNGVRKYVKRKASDPDNPESTGEKA